MAGNNGGLSASSLEIQELFLPVPDAQDNTGSCKSDVFQG